MGEKQHRGKKINRS